MFTDTLDGAAKQHFGRLEEAVGDLIGDRQLQAKGVLDDAAGAVEQVYGLASDTAHEALSQAARRARNARGDLEDLVAGRPILATGITLGIGIALGAFLIGGGRAVYRRPAGRDEAGSGAQQALSDAPPVARRRARSGGGS